uniref:Retrotransposon protein, putative, Ty3-gypsy sub-class n=1 Tax=Oryza sativa subsp. japonica TaxID=39947 RepID=Q75LW7_ORYSJ|nr:retrotransposon protein, putative, Ty3-gypsy sub-class [Oryza sativa Japonica Group]
MKSCHVSKRINFDEIWAADGDDRRRQRGRGGGGLRVVDGGGAPAVFGRNGGQDEDGGDLANLAMAFLSDGGDWSSGDTWLDSRRRRRRTG